MAEMSVIRDGITSNSADLTEYGCLTGFVVIFFGGFVHQISGFSMVNLWLIINLWLIYG